MKNIAREEQKREYGKEWPVLILNIGGVHQTLVTLQPVRVNPLTSGYLW